MSHDFLRLPSKRQYPDYYEQIKRPVALDEIKRKLESGQYAFFEEVKQDFEQCFKNAKKYNMKEGELEAYKVNMNDISASRTTLTIP